ncbi:MAG: magnesium transporter CorA family protein [Burkholderiaceae bacterium]|jgi:Mg2+ and Co2+ transporter CorA|nr:magnesium transporter CorA family protein [Burkholderiaceae bacterium]
MQTIHVLPDRCALIGDAVACPAGGFVWLDALHAEVQSDPEAFRGRVEQLTATRIYDLHLQDAINLQHPSFFDGTQDYDMLVFRKLAPGEAAPLAEVERRDRGKRALQEIVTRPITFFVFERVLVTVRNEHSKTVDQMRARLMAERGARPANGDRVLDKQRLPVRPDELMLRLLNGMVDRYLDLRQPLTDRLERWQRELLDPRRPFSDWQALLDARIEIRRLENLCEEQLDALQELRDAYLDDTPEPQQSDAYLIRVADVIEHIRRVLSHAQRLENTIETAVQLHFSATTHRTNQVVRLLTVITAVFAPLTLLAGIWGMNFEHIPFAHHPHGFGITVASMVGIGLLLWLIFWINRFLSDQPSRTMRRWRHVKDQLFGREPR